MDKLTLLDELIIRIGTEEIKMSEESSKENVETLVWIGQIVENALYEEIVQDITNLQTAYYAPEYDSWKQFLADCNGYEDYIQVLHKRFSEDELENLWQSSHISEDMEEAEIKEKMMLQIGQLKMHSLICKKCKPAMPEKTLQRMNEIKARIQGLYNMLYE